MKRPVLEDSASNAPGFGFSEAFLAAWGDDATHPCVDQYRAAQLLGQEGERTEHLVFAANTASIAAPPAYGGKVPVTQGTVTIPFNGKQRVVNNLIESLELDEIDTGSAPGVLDEDNMYDDGATQGFLEYLQGTLLFTHDSATVSGVDTDFVSHLQEGSQLLLKETFDEEADLPPNYYVVEVAEIVSIDELTLTEPFNQIFTPPVTPEVLVTSTVKVFRPLMGSSKVILVDDGNREIVGVEYIKFVRGDVTNKEENHRFLRASEGDIEMSDPANGIVQILDTPVTRTELSPYKGDPPALSSSRGDKILEVGYYLAPPCFWWTRNDAKKTRFMWDGVGRRGSPIKGGPVKNLGLLEEATTQLTPRPMNLVVGDYLAGTQIPDAMALLRLGTLPNSGSLPLGDDPEGAIGFRGVLVVPDTIVEEEAFDFGSMSPSPVGVIGKNSGMLLWNPAVFALYAGQPIWYASDIFIDSSDGVVGKVQGSDVEPLFICPIPSPTERPLLRIGNRRWLEVLFADNDAELSGLEPDPGQVVVSLSTGQVKLSPLDITKTDMGEVEAPNEGFDPLWAGADLYYDGVAMNRVAQPLKAPRLVSDVVATGGSVPISIPVPGIGVSGVRIVEDKSGRVPDFTKDIGRRPGESGVKRSPRGLGDTFVFTPNIPFVDLKVGKRSWYDDNRPGIDQCYIHYGADEDNSSFKLNVRAVVNDSRRGHPLYFQNTDFTPATYAPDVRMCSRIEGPYTLQGDEVLNFIVGDTAYTWKADELTGGYLDDPTTYTALEVSESLNEILVDSEYEAGYLGNLLFLTHPSGEGNIEILPGLSGEKDLSGCAALGFNPFWRTRYPLPYPEYARTALDVNWLPDDGTCIGFRRTPFDKGATKGVPDFRSVNRIQEVFLGDVTGSQHVYLREAPLEDVAGIEEGVFLEMQDGPYRVPLTHMDNIYCTFGEKRFNWIDDKAVSFKSKVPVSTINFGVPGVIPESLHPVLGGCFKAREPGGEPGYQWYTEGEEYVFLNEGRAGTTILTKEIGARISRGSKGFCNEGGDLFVDTSGEFHTLGLSVGDRLKILTGDSKGSYLIKSWESDRLTVFPNFPATTESPVAWELFTHTHQDEISEEVVTDYLYKRFNHLPSETFVVNILSPIGVVDEGWAEAPPTAQVSHDVARGRDVHIRMGLHLYSNTTPISVRWLKKYEMGELSNDSLRLVSGAWCEFTDHLSDDGAFQLRVATLEIQWEEIEQVEDNDAFSEDPAYVEISQESGLLKFSQEILDTYGQATVVFEEKPFPSDLLGANECEVNPDTGEIRFSQHDIDLHKERGTTAYWVSRMITEDQTDVYLNPLAGAFMFREPLNEWQIVEVAYQTTDAAGVLLTDDEGEALPIVEEFLPLHLRAEEATRIDSNTYSFNPTGRTVRQDVEPVIYVGPEMANQPGGTVKCSIDYETNEIHFEYEIPEAPTDPLDPLIAEVSVEEPVPKETYPGSGMLKPAGDPMDMWNLAGRKVTITYAVIEAFGGESAYTVSAPPVWRPPFFIEGKQESFNLMSDRTDDLYPGQLMRLGVFLFYIKAVEYDAESDETIVSIFPKSPNNGAGTRVPGNDVLSLITEWPITRVVDPTDPVVISEEPSGEVWPTHDTTAHGFLVPLGELLAHGKADPTPINVVFEQTPQTRNEIVFFSNLMHHIGIGYIMEIGGIPYTTTGLKLSDDGTRTTVGITPSLVQGVMYGEDDVKVSVRPLYPPGPQPYLGMNQPFLSREETDVILWGERDDHGNVTPGRSLVPVQEYVADAQTGDITFQYPYQEYLEAEQRLTFRRVQIRTIRPRVEGGVATLPAFELRFKHVVAPSDENGLLGSSLVGTYSYRSPDSFYYRSLGLLDFSGETAQKIIRDAAAKSSSYGSSLAASGQDNWEQGRVSLKVEQDHLHDKDRAARAYLGFFNAVTVAFEQIDEAATGRIIGDRDGKFRFWVGKGLEWTPRGFENPVTGRLNPRYAYGSAFQSLLPSLDLPEGSEINVPQVLVDENDKIVSPFDFEVDESEDLDGQFPESELRRWMEEEQMRHIKNDIDDRVLIGYRAVNFRFFPFLNWDIVGRTRAMWQTHWMSRLFPTKASYFTTTYPGAGADPRVGDYGIYAFLKNHKDKWRSTFLNQIGTIENPVQGPIDGITNANMRIRTPRARVYEYSETGFPDLDEMLFSGGVADGNSFTNNPRPAVIATVLELAEMPLMDGKPYVDGMATVDPQNGAPDLNTGSWEDHTPPWAVGQRLLFGKPNGEFIPPKYNESFEFLPTMTSEYPDLYVAEIIKGCVMTFGYKDGDEITPCTNSAMIVDISGDSVEKILLDKSDTLTVMMGDGIIPDMDPEDIGLDKLGSYSASLPSINVGWDVSVGTSGKIRDITFPKWGDPMIGLHELFGQGNISPHTRIEGDVHFHNKDVVPASIPALLGQGRNDSGDYTLPYMKTANTELVRLRDAMGAVYEILQTDGNPAASDHDWAAVYPDEILNYCAPASYEGLRIYDDVRPVATNGSYETGTGIGDLRQGDLLLVEALREPFPGSDTKGLEGFHSVGSIEVREAEDGSTYSVIGMPRFVTRSKLGDAISYKIKNLVTVHGDFNTDAIYNTEGVRIDEKVFVGEDPANPWDGGFTFTRFEFEGLQGWDVDDGAAGDGQNYGSGFYNPSDADTSYHTSTGGLNAILAGAAVDSEITIYLLKRAALLLDDEGEPYYEPDEASDGSAKIRVRITKTAMGNNTDAIMGDDGGVPHEFEILVSDSDGATLASGRANKLWFYSDDTLPGQVLCVETYHPEDPHVVETEPEYDPDNLSGWFPWSEYQNALGDPEQYVEVIDDDPLTEPDPEGGPDLDTDPVQYDYMEDEAWIAEHRYTNLTAVEGAHADFGGNGKALEEFHVDLNISGGTHSYIKSDRLTLVGPFDPRRALPLLVEDPEDPEGLIPAAHPISGIAAHITLNVSRVTTKVWDSAASAYVDANTTVNDRDHVNGGDDFTFMRRHAWMEDYAADGTSTLEGVGYWSEGTGSLKVCGFQGHGNTFVSFVEGQTMMASAIPSSDLLPVAGTVLDPVDALGAMISYVETDDPAVTTPDLALWSNRITPVCDDLATPEDNESVSFDCSKVVPGDMVYVKSGAEGSASEKVGSYLVRYALASSGASNFTPEDLLGTGVAPEAPIRPVSLQEASVTVGTAGVLDLSLPTIRSLESDDDGDRLLVTGLSMDDNLPTTSKTGWEDSGMLYILVTNVQSDYEDDVWAGSVVRVEYTGVEAEDGSGHFELDMGTVTDANGAALVDGDGIPLGEDALRTLLGSYVGKSVTGAKYFSVMVKHPLITERDERLVGYNWNKQSYGDPGTVTDQAVYGFVAVGVENPRMAEWATMDADGVRFTGNRVGEFGGNTQACIEPAEAPSGGGTPTLLVGKCAVATPGEFQEDIDTPVYDNIPAYIDLSQLNFTDLNKNDAGDGELDCLLPMTKFSLTLWMDAGVFLEPSFPRSTFDLARDKRSLVTNESVLEGDADTLDADEVGERQALDHLVSTDVEFEFTEHVTFTVRRIRRFHDVLLGLSDSMGALRFAYETRRGSISSYTPGSIFHSVVLADYEGVSGWGTQLGPCDDEDVNIHPGDILRVLDPETGELKGWAEISKVESGTELKLNPPGFIGETPEEGDPVEIYLRRMPVPHEQSNEELLELATEEVVMTRTATLESDNGEGMGYPAAGGIVKWDEESAEEGSGIPGIYEASMNWLTDTNAGLEDGQINFLSKGVEVGDYLLIDPAGELCGPEGNQPEVVEYGMRPFGDIGCEVDQDNFQAGAPSEVDDNRGYYQVVEVQQDRIKVSPSRGSRSDFIGDSGIGPDLGNALHGGTADFETSFALYPTIHGSGLTNSAAPGDPPNGEEGQGDLRPTAFAGEDPLAADPWDGNTLPNSFEGNPFSVGPFSYKIIRPTRLLRADCVELILFHRERIMSLMENFESAMKENKKGSYWVFQDKRHAYDLGKPTIPDTGLGVPRNNFLYGLAGQFRHAPFLNDSDCLSCLDRRVILEDAFLDVEYPPNDDPENNYTAFTGGYEWGLPLLLTRIEEVLDRTDRIRPKRFAWLQLRATRTDGTLIEIHNWKRTLRDRLRERRRMRTLQESMGD